MWQENRFVATRDPSRGGLQICAATPGFDQNVEKEIYDNFLELISKDFDHPCTAVYPLSDGRYAVCMAQKVSSSKRESRVHDMIRGIIVTPEELEELCSVYIFRDKQREIFFPEHKIDPDNSKLWMLQETRSVRREDYFDQYMNRLEFRQSLGLYAAMTEIAKGKIKVQLVVPEGQENETLAICTSVAALAGARLFITADGECTLKSPDIVIMDELKYQDRNRYLKLTLNALMQMGRSLMKREQTEKETEHMDPSDVMVENLLDLCESYLYEYDDLEEELYDAVSELRRLDPAGYQRWKRKLRRELSYYTKFERSVSRYMKLLYLAFRKEDEKNQPFSPEIQLAPYDFAGMYTFLKKKASSTRELRRWLVIMLELPFAESTGFFEEKTVHEAAKRSVAKLKSL